MKKGKKPGSIKANKWQKLQQEAFEQLINTFISVSILCYYNPDCKLCIKMNISESACAGVLS
jgi:RNase H-like domain found in reverse transcriptase